jgi:hypothetical protein
MMSAMSAEGVQPLPYWHTLTNPEPHRSDQYRAGQLPADQHSQVFLDPRSGDRVLRVTWHPESDLVVLSLWRRGTCVGTFRLERNVVTPFVETLLEGLSEPVGHLEPLGPPAAEDLGVISTGAVDAQLRDVARGDAGPSAAGREFTYTSPMQPQVSALPEPPRRPALPSPLPSSHVAQVDLDSAAHADVGRAPSHRAATPPAYTTPDEPASGPPAPAASEAADAPRWEPAEGEQSLSDWIFAGTDRDAG